MDCKPLFEVRFRASWSWVLQCGAIADALDHYANHVDGVVGHKAWSRGGMESCGCNLSVEKCSILILPVNR